MSVYRIRTVRTASGATAVQVVWYEKDTTKIAKHIGSAKNEEELKILRHTAEQYIRNHEPQRSFFDEPLDQIVSFKQIKATGVSHRFARDVLLAIAKQCHLGTLEALYLDLAIMRINEPCSKLRSLQLIEQYFNISYTRYVYECLPKLLKKQAFIENAAIKTAKSFNAIFTLLLYDVTTLYFETHKPDDELQARGFSKDDKSKQPQIVIGLLVTAQGFPLMHEIYKGNTFEGHTMLDIVKEFQRRHMGSRPIIVADAAMLSRKNMQSLEADGYQYIVGARLANTSQLFIDKISTTLTRQDGSSIRLPYTDYNYDVICTYSEARARKDRREFEKQISRAKELISRKEPGKRAKFVKKLPDSKTSFILDKELKEKTEKLLGIKGYCTNIPENILSNDQIVNYYRDLWHVEQAFRMSKTDLRTRPVFHFTHDAIKAHVLLCFMAL